MFGITALISFFSAFAAKVLTVETLRFLANKALYMVLLTVVLPIVLYNVFNLICSEMVSYSLSKITAGGYSPVTVQLTGLAGWLGYHLQLPGVFSIIMSAIATRFVIKMIWK